MSVTQLAASPADKQASPEARKEAARLMGSARTPAKTEAAKRNAPINGLKGGRPQKPLAEIPCRCEAGDALEGHRWNCPRGQAIKRRQKAGKL
jgi:hypothetical protein